MKATHQKLKADYENLYAQVKAAHDADENVCMNLYAKFGAAEMALTDFEIANGLFNPKWVE